MPKVLITDGLWRKALVAVRALGKAGVQVTVTGHSTFTSSFFSRYCSRRLLTPSPSEDPAAFRRAIIGELAGEHYDLIIPMEDDSIQALLPSRPEIEKLTFFPFPSTESLLQAFDKGRTIALARELGIPVPAQFNALEQVGDSNFPIVLKPKTGSGSHGLIYVQSRGQLNSLLEDTKIRIGDYLIQDRLPPQGEGVGASLLFDRNHFCLAGFTHRRLRDYPVQGGPSTLRESTRDPELLNTSIRLLRQLDWVGVAMVEFKRDARSNALTLMEINPRFWGSLALPIAAGVNFPLLLLKMALGESLQAVFDYHVGVRARWLIPGDILHFLSNPDRFHLEPGFFRFFDKRTCYDDFDITDPSGNIAVVACTLFHALKPGMWKYVRR